MFPSLSPKHTFWGRKRSKRAPDVELGLDWGLTPQTYHGHLLSSPGDHKTGPSVEKVRASISVDFADDFVLFQESAALKLCVRGSEQFRASVHVNAGSALHAPLPDTLQCG